VLQDKAKKRQMMDEAFQTEKELHKLLKESQTKFGSRLEPDLKEIVDLIFDLQGMKDYMAEMGLDLQRLPLGKLCPDKIKRGHQVLSEIQRLLVTGEKPQMIVPLTNDFYTTIPHDFGMKKPPVIDHLLRVKANR
jgi:hypothetical protein